MNQRFTRVIQVYYTYIQRKDAPTISQRLTTFENKKVVCIVLEMYGRPNSQVTSWTL